MYNPASFRVDDLACVHDQIRRCPLALLVSHGDDGLQASPLPFILYPEEGEFGVLRAHMARANPHWRALRDGAECLVVFQGENGYVSPSWYPSKSETHRTVPTWNYVLVQVKGLLAVVEDDAWLRRQLNDLTAAQENRRVQAWSVDEAPGDYIASQMKAIIGLEIRIAHIEGKWKLSQNKTDADRAGVIQGMRAESDPHRNSPLADLMEDALRKARS